MSTQLLPLGGETQGQGGEGRQGMHCRGSSYGAILAEGSQVGTQEVCVCVDLCMCVWCMGMGVGVGGVWVGWVYAYVCVPMCMSIEKSALQGHNLESAQGCSCCVVCVYVCVCSFSLGVIVSFCVAVSCLDSRGGRIGLPV